MTPKTTVGKPQEPSLCCAHRK